MFIASSTFWLWEAFKHPGTIIVTVGVAGEVLIEWFGIPKDEKIAKLWKRMFAIMLIYGLILEIPDSAKSWQLASESSERAANTESNNLVLRSQVAELEAAVQWRTITPIQETNLVNLLSPFVRNNRLTGTVVSVMSEEGNPEAIQFARRLGDVLTKCGFNVGPMEVFAGGVPGPDAGLLFVVKNIHRTPSRALEIAAGLTNEKIVPSSEIQFCGLTGLSEDDLRIEVLAKPEK
jgi:hypothetical protein